MVPNGRPCLRAGLAPCLALFWLFGCAATSPPLPRGPVPAERVVVIGSLGLRGPQEVPPLKRRLTLSGGNDGKSWNVEFVNDLEDELEVPFFANLPAGRYRIEHWGFSVMDGEVGAEDSLEVFDGPGGQVICLGALFPVRMAFTSSTNVRGLASAGADCARLAQRLASRAPEALRGPPPRWAFEASSPSPATAAPGERRELFIDSFNGQLLVDISQGPVPGFALPPEAKEAHAKVRICVDTAGTVSGVGVIDSAGPTADPIIVEGIRRWRYQPLIIGGQPQAFCFHFKPNLKR
jgi:hypothetical protein